MKQDRCKIGHPFFLPGPVCGCVYPLMVSYFTTFVLYQNGFGESCPFLRSSFSFTMPSQMFSYMSMPEGIYLSLIVTNSSMEWVEIPIWNASLKIIAGGESKLKAAQIEVFIKPHKNFHCGDTKKNCGGCIGVGHTHCHLEWFDIDVFWNDDVYRACV